MVMTVHDTIHGDLQYPDRMTTRSDVHNNAETTSEDCVTFG